MTALIEQKPANRLARQANWLAYFRHVSPVMGIFEQTAVFNNAVIIKYINIFKNLEHLSFNLCISPESFLGFIYNRNK